MISDMKAIRKITGAYARYAGIKGDVKAHAYGDCDDSTKKQLKVLEGSRRKSNEPIADISRRKSFLLQDQAHLRSQDLQMKIRNLKTRLRRQTKITCCLGSWSWLWRQARQQQ